MILVIDGSYRDDGFTDQVVAGFKAELEELGETVELVTLRDYPIEFCLNCRECMQQPGETPGDCVLEDGMAALIDKIEQANGYILAAPTNVWSITAVFKRFMERLAPYGYWPWGAPAPKFRKVNVLRKPALLISSSAAPAWMARMAFGTMGQLRTTAKMIGARPIATLSSGLVASHTKPELSDKIFLKIKDRASLLVGKIREQPR